VRWIDEVLERALERTPVPLAEEAAAAPPPAAPAPPAEGLVVKH
jgi:ATP-dependent Lon protease